MLTPHTHFDPVAPLPPRTLANVMATGAGQAAPSRMARCAVWAGVAAFAVVAVVPQWWIVAAPCVGVSAFAVYGLATRRLFELRVLRRGSRAQRSALQAARGLAVAIGAAAVVVSVLGGVVALMEGQPPRW
jgi:hypothetical protein